VHLPLNADSLFKRQIVAFGPTTLRSTVSAGLCRLAGVRTGDVLLDPMAGSGSIPIEVHRQRAHTQKHTNTQAACSYSGVTVLCGENHPVGVDNLRINHYANVRNYCVSSSVHAFQWDARHLPLGDESVSSQICAHAA
jgi:tRNA G10  N-methylase Trm11